MAEKRPKKREESPKGRSSALEGIQAERELIVISKSEVGLRATREGVTSIEGADITPLADMLASEGVSIRPLFGVSEERLKHTAASLASKIGVEMPDFSVYYRVDAPDERLDELAGRLRELESVETAYVKPPAELPQILNDMVPTAEEPPIATPDFMNRQGYLQTAPGGIDAVYAWTQPGGGGGGVSIIDIEGSWRFTHEDLLVNQGGVVGGTQSTLLDWRNHGTAVVGEFGGDWGSYGITGISPDANVRAISIFGSTGTAGAIRQAAEMLKAGDIILIEIHRSGPRFDFQGRRDQRGYISIEWWPDDFDAIRYATHCGIIVVEAAGNGAENLDDAIYNTPAAGFPVGWTNPFNRANRDSGAIVVGAGAPPPGTHGRNHGPDRSRLDFSNYGAILDAQGWGREVTTAGYGDLQGGSNEDEWYTDRFSGTSSASPIVVGSIACVQGILRRHGRFLTPPEVRTLLRATGSSQQDAPGTQPRPRSQRIGNRPNIREMVERVTQDQTVPLYRYWNGKATDHFYTTNWNELRGGAHGWYYEGIQCYVYPQRKTGTAPLYRYWNGKAADHFYTTNWNELGGGAYGWRFEGIQCYVYPQRNTGTVPLYRYWNGKAADHFYTTNWNELRGGAHGWYYEGIQCYVYPQPLGAPSIGEKVIAETFGVEAEAGPISAERIPETFRVELEAGPIVTEKIPETFRVEAETGPIGTEKIPETFRVEAEAGPIGTERIPETFRVEP